MPDDSPRARRDQNSLIGFLILSVLINGAAVVSGYWIKFPTAPAKPLTVIELTDIQTNDVEKLGNPDAPDEVAPPPEPEPVPPPPPPPPPQETTTPPPLDKPPEFEVPEPSPTPTPTPVPTPLPSSTPGPELAPPPSPPTTPTPHPSVEKPRPPQPEKPREQHRRNPNAAATPGVVHSATPGGSNHGSTSGAPNGTGHGGSRAGTLIRSPKPPYPPQALQLGIRGDVRVQFTVVNGEIVEARAVSGPPMLSSAVIRWTRANWKFAPGTNGVFTLPVSFQIQ